MTAIPISLTQSTLQTVQRSFLLSILDPCVQVVEGRQNRVAPPACPDYVIMLKAVRMRLATNSDTWVQSDPLASVITASVPMECRTQFDFHGPNSADNAQRVFMLWRDPAATTFFAASGYPLAPLYATEPRYMTFENDSDQWEDRWIVEGYTQGNFAMDLPQDFANSANVSIVGFA